MSDPGAQESAGQAGAEVREDVKKFLSDETWSTASSTWLNNDVRNSPISQAVEAWNHLGTILPKLRDYIEAELKRAQAQK